MTYHEYNEMRTQKSVPYEVIDFPDIVVTESELPEPDFPLTEGDA